MTELKNELKAAMMEMFVEMFQPQQKTVKSTGFGPLTAVGLRGRPVHFGCPVHRASGSHGHL
jgi:hypothetical protein